MAHRVHVHCHTNHRRLECQRSFAHQRSTSANGRSSAAPKSGWRLRRARVCAGLLMPHRNLARWRASPSAPGCSTHSCWNARRSIEPRQRRERGRRRQRGRAAVQAVGAVTARRGPALAKVADQRVDLAARVRDQRRHAVHARDLLRLSASNRPHQLGHQRASVLGRSQPAIALAHVRGAHLGPALLFEIFDRAHDACAILSQRRADLRGVERVPGAPFLRGVEEGGDELRALTLEPRGDLRWSRAAAAPRTRRRTACPGAARPEARGRSAPCAAPAGGCRGEMTAPRGSREIQRPLPGSR